MTPDPSAAAVTSNTLIVISIFANLICFMFAAIILSTPANMRQLASRLLASACAREKRIKYQSAIKQFLDARGGEVVPWVEVNTPTAAPVSPVSSSSPLEIKTSDRAALRLR